MTGALLSFMFIVSSPLHWQITASTKAKASEMMENTLARYSATLDANDLIYPFDSSSDRNPQPYLSKIKAPSIAINSVDNQVNTSKLGLMEKEIKNVKKERYILLLITDKATGHGTHSNPKIKKNYLKELLEKSQPQMR